MRLATDFESYFGEKDLEREHEQNYRRAERRFSEFLGRPATRDDLQETLVNQWLKHLAEDYGPAVVRAHRAAITAIWNWLAEQRLVTAYDTRRLRKVTVQYGPPRAWSLPQVRILLQAAEQMSGQLRCGIKASQLMTAVLMLSYSTGFRHGDLMRLRRIHLDGSRLSMIQHKSKHPHTIDISDDVCDALAPLLALPGDRVIPVSLRTMRTWTDRLFAAAAELGFSKQKGQGLGTLRKSGATEVARLNGPEAASRYLGHKSGIDIALKHYIEPAALGDTPTPPRILVNELAHPRRATIDRCRTAG